MKCTCYNLKVTNYEIRIERIPSKAIKGEKGNKHSIQKKGRKERVDARLVARKLSLHTQKGKIFHFKFSKIEHNFYFKPLFFNGAET